MLNPKLFYIVSALCCFILFQATQYNSSPTNQDIPATGAPSENTCSTEPGCHSGGAYDGTIEFEGLPDTIIHGETYFLTYTFKSNAVRTGFEITCLDEQNKPCGTWISGFGSSRIDNNIHNRSYLRMSNAPYMVNGEMTWHFAWTAPNEGNLSIATFYMASLAGNGNNEKYGDNAITNVHSVYLPQTTSTLKLQEEIIEISVAPNPSNGLFHVQAAKPCTATIYSLYGKLIQTTEVSEGAEIDLTHLKSGVYCIQFTNRKNSKIQMVQILK